MIGTALEYHLVPDRDTAGVVARGAFLAQARSTVVLVGVLVPFIALLVLVDPVLATVGAILLVSSSVVLVVTYRQQLRIARAGYQPGVRSIARYDTVIRLMDEQREQQLPYPLVTRVRVTSTVVVLRISEALPLVLPVQLCPPEAQQRIAAGIASGITPEPDLAGFTHVRAVDEPFLRALLRRALPNVIRQPAAAVTLVALALIIGVLGVAVDPVAAIAAVAGLFAFIGLFAIAMRARVRKVLSGQVLRARFDADSFTLLERGVITRRPYSDVRAFRSRGEVVEVLLVASPLWEAFPASLFPDEVRARLS